jgi:hypothetical protein
MTESSNPTAEPFRATHLTPDEVAALYERLARYRRRREAAERGEDWQSVR